MRTWALNMSTRTSIFHVMYAENQNAALSLVLEAWPQREPENSRFWWIIFVIVRTFRSTAVCARDFKAAKPRSSCQLCTVGCRGPKEGVTGAGSDVLAPLIADFNISTSFSLFFTLPHSTHYPLAVMRDTSTCGHIAVPLSCQCAYFFGMVSSLKWKSLRQENKTFQLRVKSC